MKIAALLGMLPEGLHHSLYAGCFTFRSSHSASAMLKGVGNDVSRSSNRSVIIPEHDGFACRQMSWGWRVPWDKQPLINAKSETITQLPTFKPHLQNRCLILADGFFEKGIRFIQPGEPLFAMAGLWQSDAAGGRFTMLTTTPNASVSPYHHRMPFILRAEQLGAWLGDDWLAVLENPDRAPLDKIQKQAELF